MIHKSYIISLFNISKHFNLPNDIIQLIYFFYIHSSAQLIIHKWYDNIMVRNINLVYIISRIPLYTDYDIMGTPFFYFNLYDINVGISFNICRKYINFNISDIEWWTHRINYALNGLNIFSNKDNPNYIYNVKSISRFYKYIFY